MVFNRIRLSENFAKVELSDKLKKALHKSLLAWLVPKTFDL